MEARLTVSAGTHLCNLGRCRLSAAAEGSKAGLRPLLASANREGRLRGRLAIADCSTKAEYGASISMLPVDGGALARLAACAGVA